MLTSLGVREGGPDYCEMVVNLSGARVPEAGKGWRPVLFDMDGTLVDSEVAIVSRIEDTAREFGARPLPDRAELRHLIGPPTRQALADFVPENRMDEAVAFYKSLVQRQGTANMHLFPGIANALAELREGGVPLALATSKPQDEAERLAREFGIDNYLTAIVGATEQRPHKADVVGQALVLLETASVHAPLMVGDRLWDIEGAAAHDVPTALVRWGYAREEEFAQAFADIATVSDLVAFVLDGTV